MQGTPFEDVCQRSLWELPVDLPGGDLYRDLEVTVNGMEVRRGVIAVVHRNDDPEESADLWHDKQCTDGVACCCLTVMAQAGHPG